jgi:hemolysin III
MASVIAPPKPRLRGRIHQVAFFVSIPAGLVLVFLASGPAATAVGTVYAVSLAAMFGSSAAYHRGQWNERARQWMKRLDHSLIFVLIAASYTPVAALVLGGPWEVVLLSVIWAGAVVGITMKIARPDGFSVPSGVLYMVMGWLAVVAFPQLLREMTPAELILLVSGGLLYTVGAIVLASRRPDPSPTTFGYHEVWHSFMVAAAACHYTMILLLLLPS